MANDRYPNYHVNVPSIKGQNVAEKLTPQDPNRYPDQSVVIPPFYPTSPLKSHPDYQEFLKLRGRILDVVRKPSDKKEKVVEDLVDALLVHDYFLPTGPVKLGCPKRYKTFPNFWL